jgi:arylsulfatase A-like enzyme
LILDQKWSHTSFVRNLTLETLQEAKDTGLPFNITASFNFPHPPVIATDPAFSLYRDKDGRPIKELDALISPSIDDRSKTSPYNLSTKDAVAYYYDRTKITDFMSVYYGLVSEVDGGIGEIVQKLKDIGEYDNTLIIYCSDHGETLGAHGLIGKFVFYEESILVPLILKLPNSAHKGLKIERPVNLTDLFATILDYTIGETKEDSEGKSLRTLIENPQTKQWKDYTVSEWAAERLPVLCVITKDWKFLAGKNDKTRSALYDRKKDPNELVNLLYDISDEEREKYRGTVNDLKNKLLEYMTEIHHADTETVRNFDYFTRVEKQ